MNRGPAAAAERIADDIKRRIFEGDLPPSSPLREAVLASHYSASRHTVRAALRELVSAGLVIQDSHRSAQVRALIEPDIRDLYSLRRLLELDALRRLIDTDASLARLEQAVTRREAVEADAEHAGANYSIAEIDTDLDFHRALVHSVGSERLSRIFESLADELRLAFLAFVATDGDRGDHRRILNAVRDRDTELASALLNEHLRDGLRVCLDAAQHKRARLAQPALATLTHQDVDTRIG